MSANDFTRGRLQIGYCDLCKRPHCVSTNAASAAEAAPKELLPVSEKFTLFGWDSPVPMTGTYEVVIRLADDGPILLRARMTALECQRLCVRVETPDPPAKPVTIDAEWIEHGPE